jgi:diguanylate cyclase (GGDEF)-like protein
MTKRQPHWQPTYLLGVGLLLPIGTIVLTASWFAKIHPLAVAGQPIDPWAFSIIAIAGGLSGLMAALLAVFAFGQYRQRRRLELEYRSLQRYLNDTVLKERVKLQRNLDLFSASQQVSMAIKQEVDTERILSVVLEQLESFARPDDITVFVVDKRGVLVPRARREKGVDRFTPELKDDEVEYGLTDEALTRAGVARLLDRKTGDCVLCSYFATPEGVRGVVRLSKNVSGEPDFEEDLPAWEQAVVQLVRMLSLGLKAGAMWDRAIKDEKTGLYNANHYADQLRKKAALARKSHSPLSLIMLDIDKFKHINDTYGHLAGDMVLAQVSEILIREARETDTPFRYGGEELCILCQGSSEDDAARCAERLRSLVARTEFRDDQGRLLPISASFGVARLDEATMPTEKELKLACDAALYHAKQNGRNLVVVSRGPAQFTIIERSGEPALEVKRRMGLAGDNSPLPLEAPAAGAAKPSARLGESIDALATDLAEAVKGEADRTRIIDSVVREAAAIITQNLSARFASRGPAPAGTPAQARADTQGEPAPAAGAAQAEVKTLHENLAPAPKRRRQPCKKKPDPEAALEPALIPAAPGEPAGPAPVKRQRRSRKKQAEAADPLKVESDRLDFITGDEGEQLLRGEAPSKRLRKA